MSKAGRDVNIKLQDLMDAFDSGSAEIWNYLDLDTGEIVMVTEDTRQQLEALIEATDAETLEAIHMAIHNQELPDWEKDSLAGAALVEFADNSRFVEIPRTDSREGYADMEAFIETVSQAHVQELLQVAIRGKGAFRRFKDVLVDYPEERERWFTFRDERLRQRVLDWLEMEDIHPIL